MGKKTEATITIDGIGELSRFNSLKMVQRLFGHHEFHLQVPIDVIESKDDYILGQSKDLIGRQFSLTLESPGISERPQLNFVGIVTQVSLLRVPGSGSEILISGASPTILLDGKPAIQSFEEKSFGDIASDILSEYDSNMLDHEVSPSDDPTIPYVVQYRESHFHFFSRMCEELGEWMFYNGEVLKIGAPSDDDYHELVLSREIKTFDIGIQTSAIKSERQIYYAETNERWSGSADQLPEMDNMYGQYGFNASDSMYHDSPLDQVNPLLHSDAELGKFNNNYLAQDAAALAKLSASSDYHAVTIGSVVSIEGNRAEDPSQGLEKYGEFRVTHVVHMIDGNGNYENRFEGIPSQLQIPPHNPLVRRILAETQTARVVENNDPEKLGRIRVQFDWQIAEDMKSPWIRMMQTHAGAGHGVYVLPEIDDEVMVSFEMSRADRPYIIGSLYNGGAKPGEHLYSDDNYNKGIIKTDAGNEIKIVDEGGKESIHILNKGGKNSIVLTMDGGAINISAQSKINITSKEINIVGEDKIKMESKLIEIEGTDQIKAKGRLIQVKADDQISMFTGDKVYHNMDKITHHLGSTNMDFQAKSEVTIKGLTSTLEGTTSVDVKGLAAKVEGTATAEITGATTKVNGSAMTEVKGGMVKLN